MRSNQLFSRFRYVCLGLVALFCVVPVFAQGFRVENQTEPSVVDGGSFVSLEGKFTIALPQSAHGFRPLTSDTPLGRASGTAYSWTMKEGSFTVGYVEAPQALDEPDTVAKIFGGIRNSLSSLAEARGGKIIDAREYTFDNHPALESKLEYTGGLIRQRFYVISRRLYQVMLFTKPEQRSLEAVAVKAVDSFKVLSDADVSAALKAKEAASEPAALPQQPVAPRAGSDAKDNGLRGKVKSVFQENEDLSGTWSVQGRKPESKENYNEQGNLTRQESYDYRGNLFQIMVFGYLDGARVASRKTIEREYNPPGIAIGSPGAAKSKFDSRYSNKFGFRYDAENRLIEKSWFLSNGDLTTKDVYKYSGNSVEELVYAEDGSLNQRYLSILDKDGNEIERTSFDQDGSIREKYKLAYEFDAHGNWIKRITSKPVTKDGGSDYAPAYVDYRTISYY